MTKPASRPNRWAFKVLACDYLDHHDLEALGLSADWYLYLSPVSPPSMDAAMQQMNAHSLLACPCCGGDATIIGYHLTNEWSAICRSCGLETAHKMEPAAAAEDWNRRFAPDEEGHDPQHSRDEAAHVLSILVGGLARDDYERAKECISTLATPAQPKASCTCPSGDGSLRWPCPQHPPEQPKASEAVEHAFNVLAYQAGRLRDNFGMAGAALNIEEAAATLRATHPKASEGKAGGEDARDAARYRWLRDAERNWRLPHVHINTIEGMDDCAVCFGPALDTAIDEAMTATLTAPGADDGQ